jgi:NhaP-type Na+/H+ or K+/H+ antiporter
MENRIAGASAFLVFAVCLLAGLGADNTFATTVERALAAMGVTLVIGLVLGVMARKMLEENVKSAEEKMKKNYGTPTQGDR